ncbi:hypothetical protein [Streptomyces nitrosporeus]|uniref:hypothetical protein n=1 Tax=Streptomyces nitrosporeus TaxID=28894 RepID=UPI00332AA710
MVPLPHSDEGRREYLSANKDLIRAAAHDAGLPPEMIAGISWQEAEGGPGALDDPAFEVREIIPGEDPGRTSMDSIALQVRRAAELLGYDDAHLTGMQRSVVDAVEDPAKNVFTASDHLVQLKAESGFAGVPPEEMTRARMQERAARSNGALLPVPGRPGIRSELRPETGRRDGGTEMNPAAGPPTSTPPYHRRTSARLGTGVCALILALGALVTAYTALTAYMVEPGGPWDRQAVTNARAAATIALAFSAVTALLTWVFVKAHWLRTWWHAVSAALAVAALLRLTLLAPGP